MKHHAPIQQEMSSQLQSCLKAARNKRFFDVNAYIEAKAFVLNAYMKRHKLTTCVIGVSGGVDSAVVLGIVAAAKCRSGSIKKIIPVLLPVLSNTGSTNQVAATKKAVDVCCHFGLGLEIEQFNMDSVVKHINYAFPGSPWAVGQLVSYLRTPLLYYMASLSNDEGDPAIVLGTTNRDEGGYIGFFGKASDGMVDVQLISDLHKSEVYQVAKALKIPKEIIDAAPTGDMFDGRIDEEVFGVSYDFVELFTHVKTKLISLSSLNLCYGEFQQLAANMYELHEHNKHKYAARSPAIHLDVYPAFVPGGWDNSLFPQGPDRIIDKHVEMPSLTSLTIQRTPALTNCVRVLSFTSTREILNHSFDWLPVGVDGYKRNSNEPIGSWRCTKISQQLADMVWTHLRNHILPFEFIGEEVWRAVGVANVFRFIKYTANGILIPHYDDTYIYNPHKRTLKSVVIALTDVGSTRFIREDRENHEYSDWNIVPTPDQIVEEFHHVAGFAIIFDHRTLHDSTNDKNVKISLRTDIVYERVF